MNSIKLAVFPSLPGGHFMLEILYYFSIIHIVPPPTITTTPNGTVQGAMVGDPLLVQCIVHTVYGVEPSLVSISWMGPGKDLVVNTSRVTVSQITSSHNTYNRSLHFTSLFEDNAGVYMCFGMIFETNESSSFEIQPLAGMQYTLSMHISKVLYSIAT